MICALKIMTKVTGLFLYRTTSLTKQLEKEIEFYSMFQTTLTKAMERSKHVSRQSVRLRQQRPVDLEPCFMFHKVR
jgi:hypothetical protein